jgi:hypothetical protein
LGLGAYVFAEWHSVSKENPVFKAALMKSEVNAIKTCTDKWFPKQTPQQSCGFLTPTSGSQFGRTSILPALFDDHNDAQMGGSWRQNFTTAGHQTLISGALGGNVIPEDFIVEWVGLAFPNKEQHITEVKWQISNRKYGRLNLEEMHSYNKPAIIFEEGIIINEKEAFDLYGYVEGPIPNQLPFIQGLYQSIIMLGACYYRVVDRVLGNCGAAIT